MSFITDPALETYESLAAAYDAFIEGYDHELWFERLEAVARRHGLTGRRALDVACGTGASTQPLVDRGYDVWACDLSPAMVAQAARRPSLDPDRLLVADMRALPDLGAFDLITCLDDAVNYLLSHAELVAALRSVRESLTPDGLYVFDCNTLLTYRTTFAEQHVRRRNGSEFTWTGRTSPAAPGGCVVTADVRLTGLEGVTEVTHHQRHHPITAVVEAATAAGLRLVAVLGQTTGCRLHADADELLHTKTVFVACRDDRGRKGGESVTVKP